MSVSSEVQRTIVKSPPELWAELSDPASLANHLGELGEIRIVRAVPETTVEWEAPEVTGRVQIKPSAWGTRVTLSVTREQAQLDPEAQLVGAGVSAVQSDPQSRAQLRAQPGSELAASTLAHAKAASEAASGSAPPADVETAPGASTSAESAGPAEVVSGPGAESESALPADADSAPGAESESAGPADMGSAPAPESENPGKLGPGRTPDAEPAERAPSSVGAASHPDAESAASEPEHHPEGVATAGDPPESQPALTARRRFLKRAWRRLRRLHPVTPAPSVVVESAEGPLPALSAVAAGEPSPMVPPSESSEERAMPEPSPVAAGEPSPALSPSESGEKQTGAGPNAVAAGEPSPAVSPSESGGERVVPGPSAVAAGEAASTTGLALGRSDGSNDAELERPMGQTSNCPPDRGELERRTAEEMTAVLTSMLDRLGAAHHRPFSRG